jgi:hypothetical protein
LLKEHRRRGNRVNTDVGCASVDLCAGYALLVLLCAMPQLPSFTVKTDNCLTLQPGGDDQCSFYLHSRARRRRRARYSCNTEREKEREIFLPLYIVFFFRLFLPSTYPIALLLSLLCSLTSSRTTPSPLVFRTVLTRCPRMVYCPEVGKIEFPPRPSV